MVECVDEAGAILGESPVWDGRSGLLRWIDCKAPALHAFDPARGPSLPVALPRRTGSIGLAQRGLVAAMDDGFHRLDPGTGAAEPIAAPEPTRPDNRFNDGRCDRQGRFWAGTMHRTSREPTGTLWRLDPDGTCTSFAEGIRVPNGIAVSPDGGTLYFADSPRGGIDRFDLDPTTGAATSRRPFAAADVAPGWPDGATVDEEGFYWSARWQGGCVARIAPDGTLDRIVQLPVERVTSCAFGGPDLRTLYVTSARVGLDERQLAAQPLSGGLFALDVGVAGLPEPIFGASA